MHSKNSGLIFVGLIVLAVLSGAGIAVVARSLGLPARSAQPTQNALAPDNTIRIIRGGIPQPFKQGTVLPITGKIMGQLNLRTAEVVFLRKFDLFLYQDTPKSPYEKATVEIVGIMPDMTHSDFKLNAEHIGGGHYSVILPCGMNGEWQFDVEIDAEGKHGLIQILVDVFE